MSMEHIFRNLNDIRVFDMFSEMGISNHQDEALDIHDVIQLLDCGEIERIQIEDSIDHLVREQILSIELIDTKWETGCESCAMTDKSGQPRPKGHETHAPMTTGTSKIEHYYLSNNELVECLIVAVLKSSLSKAEKMIKDKEGN